MKLTLDSNVLVYAADAESEHHLAAARLLRRAAAANCVQTLQSLGECFHVLRGKRRHGIERAREAVVKFQQLFPIVEAAATDLGDAIQAVSAHQISFWDAMLWATAKRAGCRMILTEDFQDGRTLDGLLYVNPFNPDNTRLLDLALPSTNGASP